MKSLALNDSHDIFAEEGGSLAMVEGDFEVEQHIKVRLLFHKGEWFLNVEIGVDWIDRILTRPFNSGLAEILIKREILGTEGVDSITDFTLERGSKNRIVRACAFTVLTDNNEIIQGGIL